MFRKRRFNLLTEWTNCCNIRCKFCPIDDGEMRPKGHMSLDLWSKILSDCKKNGHFVNWVHHLGEPLLWSNFMIGMQMWRKSGLSSKGHISTNGILLNDDKLKIIQSTGIASLRVCLDTLDPDVYKQLRNNDGHAKVIENIQRALEVAPDVNLELQLMRTSLNPGESPEDFYDYFGHDKNFKVFHTTVMNVGRSADFFVLPSDKIEPKFCDKIDYQHCVVGWDGTVGLCCPDYFLLNKLGNLSDGSISQVFDGKYAKKVRRLIRRGDYSLARACPQCSMDHMRLKAGDRSMVDGSS